MPPPDDTPQPPAPPVELPPGQRLDLGDRGVTFVRDQPGPPGAPTLVLLHGWLATADLNWWPSYGPLSDHFRVVTIDHRGHGRGIRTDRRFRLADCADDVAATIDALDLPAVIAVGYSMGGPIAQLLWHRHPETVAGLVFCATSRNFAGKPGERAAFALLAGAGAMTRAVPERIRLAARERVTGRRYDGDTPAGRWARSEFSRHDPRMLIEAGQALGRFSSHEWIGDIDVPAAVVLTERDNLVPPHRQRKLAHALVDCRVFPVDGDHVVCAEAPERFVPVLVQACRDTATRAGLSPRR